MEGCVHEAFAGHLRQFRDALERPKHSLQAAVADASSIDHRLHCARRSISAGSFGSHGCGAPESRKASGQPNLDFAALASSG